MVKRNNDNIGCNEPQGPPPKKVKNCEQGDMPTDVMTGAHGPVKDGGIVILPTTSSETELGEPMTPKEWEKSDDETGRQSQGPAPSLDDVKTLFQHIDYVPEGDMKRLLLFAQKADDINLCYAILAVPSTTKWGSSPKTAKQLCVNDKPITIWAIGNVETMWFRDLQGKPHDRVNIGYRLPFIFDTAGLEKLFNMACPKHDIEDLTYAAWRMTIYKKGKSMPTILPFMNIYNAHKRFQAKSQMAKLEPSSISKHDIVLIEGKFTHWNTTKDKCAQKEWKLWDVAFELEAISLLFKAPLNTDPALTKDVEDIEDDM